MKRGHFPGPLLRTEKIQKLKIHQFFHEGGAGDEIQSLFFKNDYTGEGG
jgi:hypothetical protein